MYVSHISKMNEWKKRQIEGGENSSSDVYEEKGKVS
jgi:hypothetical protein